MQWRTLVVNSEQRHAASSSTTLALAATLSLALLAFAATFATPSSTTLPFSQCLESALTVMKARLRALTSVRIQHKLPVIELCPGLHCLLECLGLGKLDISEAFAAAEA